MDMIILACVRHITDFSIEVELPGIIFGHINNTRISDAFTKLLNKKLETADDEVREIEIYKQQKFNFDHLMLFQSHEVLKKMFHKGQLIPVKVLQVEERERGIHVECTINPRDIFNGKSHNWFKKGMLIWGSIESILDHGYEVNIGVKNCRVFLPSKNIDNGRNFRNR